MENQSAAPYPVPDDQRPACPKCGHAMATWPQGFTRCRACDERFAPCKSRVDGLTRLLHGTEYEIWLDAEREESHQAAMQRHRERQDMDEQNALDRHRERLAQLRQAVFSLDGDERLSGLQELVLYAVRLEEPTWPELAAKVDRLNIARDAEFQASAVLHYKFVASTSAPCATARLLDQQIHPASWWYLERPQRTAACGYCHCRLEQQIPGLDYDLPEGQMPSPEAAAAVTASMLLINPAEGLPLAESPDSVKNLLGWTNR